MATRTYPKAYEHIAKDRYDVIISRADNFRECVGDINKEPVTVYDPLSKKQLEELELIREVSRELQAKKEEDMKKQAQAAATQAEEEAKRAAEAKQEQEAKEEDKEEK